MKIACIDSSAQQRLSLKQRIESAFEACRSYIGHVETISIVPASLEEVLVQRAPDICIVGPGRNLDDAARVCLELKKHFSSTEGSTGGAVSSGRLSAVFVVVSAEQHDLRTLRRFECLAAELFTAADPPARIVHKILQYGTAHRTNHLGRTIAIAGVKGGVGATSIATGLAHAAHAVGKSSVLIDLSSSGSLASYCGAARHWSHEFASMLHENRAADENTVRKAVITAPNGLDLLLSPGLSADTRDVWLRDPKKFEVTLEVLDHLERLFDVVFIDLAGAEGVLPFALQSRAFSRLLVSADDPAAVHLLARRLEEIRHIPGAGRTHLLINSIAKGGIARRDIIDFLSINEWFDQLADLLEPISFEQRGRDWIGTGNSFYTESSQATQRILEQALRLLLLDAAQIEVEIGQRRSLTAKFKNWLSPPAKERSLTPRFLRILPGSGCFAPCASVVGEENSPPLRLTGPGSDRAAGPDTAARPVSPPLSRTGQNLSAAGNWLSPAEAQKRRSPGWEFGDRPIFQIDQSPAEVFFYRQPVMIDGEAAVERRDSSSLCAGLASELTQNNRQGD